MKAPSAAPYILLLAGIAVAAVIATVLTSACDPDDPTVCGAGEVNCPDYGCVNTSNSSDHCGTCGNACDGCDTCIMGQCTPNCCPGQRNCGGRYDLDCVDTTTSREHCGDCNVACAEDEYCLGGECTVCPSPRTVCANACADLMTDIQHCGECNHPCTDSGMHNCNCGECAAEPGPTGNECRGVDGDADGDVDGDADGDVDGDADADADASGSGDADAG